MPSKPTFKFTDYLRELPPERRNAVRKVRAVLKENMPAGYTESVMSGMLTYTIPLARYSNTYNKQPLWYAALASQKNYLSLHLMGVYGSPALRKKLEDAFKQSGKKANMGKACIRFQNAADLPLDAIGELVAEIPAEKWIEIYESSRKK